MKLSNVSFNMLFLIFWGFKSSLEHRDIFMNILMFCAPHVFFSRFDTCIQLENQYFLVHPLEKMITFYYYYIYVHMNSAMHVFLRNLIKNFFSVGPKSCAYTDTIRKHPAIISQAQYKYCWPSSLK